MLVSRLNSPVISSNSRSPKTSPPTNIEIASRLYGSLRSTFVAQATRGLRTSRPNRGACRPVMADITPTSGGAGARNGESITPVFH